MFERYVKTKNKKPTQALSRRKYYNSNQLKLINGDYGGVLENDYIMIDIDTTVESKVVFDLIDKLNIKCWILETSRGMHFYFRCPDEFKSNRVCVNTALGVIVDVKLGKRNTIVPLKVKGVERVWLKRLDDDNVDMLPTWLYPVRFSQTKFYEMDQGGRNQALFNYILKLQNENFIIPDIKLIIRTINKLFKYPLSDIEIDTILRKQSFKNDLFFNGRTFLHDKFAKYIHKNNNVVKINGIMYVYDNVNQEYNNNLEKTYIEHITNMTKTKRIEVTSYLSLICKDVQQETINKIMLSNGVFDLDTNILNMISKDTIIINKLPVKYNKSAYCEHVDNLLNRITCNDTGVRELLCEMIGYMLLRKNIYAKSFFLIGEGANGKSTLINILKMFLGNNNYTCLELEELNSRFLTAELSNKLSNFGEDISNQYISNNAKFKKLVSGEGIVVEKKGKDPFQFVNYAKFIFSANELPKINDNTFGLIRRLIIIPFNARFTVDDPEYDPLILDKVSNENSMSYILNLGIDGLRRVLDNKGFTKVMDVEKELEEYRMMNNPLIAFVNDEDVKIDDELVKVVYENYKIWCIQNNYHGVSKLKFCKEMHKLGYTSVQKKINRKNMKLFVKE